LLAAVQRDAFLSDEPVHPPAGDLGNRVLEPMGSAEVLVIAIVIRTHAPATRHGNATPTAVLIGIPSAPG